MPFLGRVDEDQATFPAAGALGMHLVVQLDAAGTVSLAGAADAAIGVTMRETYAANDEVAVRLLNAPTHEVIAGGAIAVGDAVYQGASGKVAAAGTVQLGVALSAATADGDIIIIAPASA